MSNLTQSVGLFILVVGGLFLMQSCDVLSSGGSANSSQFDVQFEVNRSSNTSAKKNYAISNSKADSLVVSGSNGTLVIRDIHMIVDEFKLDRASEECEDDTTESDTTENEREREECEESFEAPSAFVDLPLDGSPVDVVEGAIPEGTYDEMKFEVKDIDFDEEGDDDEQENANEQELADTVRSAFPNWPNAASLVVKGEFRNADTTRSYQTFVEAEIKIEREFEPALTVNSGDTPKALNVTLDPAVWFKRSDGTVRDLSRFDYRRSEELLKLEVEFEEGFGKIEVEDDQEEEDDDDED